MEKSLSPSSWVVYVVDDDAAIRKAMERLLRSAGYRSETFQSAEEFIDAVSNTENGCLVLDIRLPGMNGFELQEKLTRMGVNYPVIFITAHENPLWRERAKKAGAVAFLKKPFLEKTLFDAIGLCREKGPQEGLV